MKQFLAKRKQRKQQAIEAGHQANLEAQRRRQQTRRQHQRAQIQAQLDIARNPAAAYNEAEGCPIARKRGEEVIGIIPTTALYEVTAGKVEYRGGSQGVSIRVARGLTYRTGGHKGTIYRAPERPRLKDTGGTFVITNQRGVYVGTNQTRVFEWSKIVALSEANTDTGTVLLMPVENRVKTSGVFVGDSYKQITARCEIGIALYRGTIDDLIAELQTDLAQLGPTPAN